MRKVTIGSIISAQRYEKGYSRRIASQGLCSTQMLIKIENDEAETDKFVLDMILQRLGKSSDRLETIISDNEYQKMCCRKAIEVDIWKGRVDEAHNLLENYAIQYSKRNAVHEMFVLQQEVKDS